jgi:hypothetical protein
MPSSGMLLLIARVRTGVSEENIASIITVTTIPDSCHSDDGGDTFLRNIGSYKIYTAYHLRRRHCS